MSKRSVPWLRLTAILAALAGAVGVLGGDLQEYHAVETDSGAWLIGTDPPVVHSVANRVGLDSKLVSRPPLPPRRHAAVFSFEDTMFIIGGEDAAQPGVVLRDIWTSTDGVQWINSANLAPWSDRLNATIVLEENRIVFVGGWCFHGVCEDDWASKDGLTWLPEVYVHNCPLSAAMSHCRDCADPNSPNCVGCLINTPVSPCSGEGTCAPNGTCICNPGWAGANCSDCAPAYYGPSCKACGGNRALSNGTVVACSGHGSCDGGGTHEGTGECTCDYNWDGGLVCSYCTNFFAGADCNLCDTGFWGPDCSPCMGYSIFTGLSCSGHGTCYGSGTQGGNGSCACDPLWNGNQDCSLCTPSHAGSTCEDCASDYWGPTCKPCSGYIPYTRAACSGNGVCVGGGTHTGDGTCACDWPFTGPICGDCEPGYWGQYCYECPGLNLTAGTWCSGHGKCTSDGNCDCDDGFGGDTCENIVPRRKPKDFVHTVGFIVLMVGIGVVIVIIAQSVYVYKRVKAQGPFIAGVDTTLFLVTSAEEQQVPSRNTNHHHNDGNNYDNNRYRPDNNRRYSNDGDDGYSGHDRPMMMEEPYHE